MDVFWAVEQAFKNGYEKGVADMREKARIPYVLEVVAAAWEQNPDLRLGQLLLNVVRDPALYYIEDENLIKAIRDFYGV